MIRILLLIGIIAFVSPLHAQTSSPSASPSLEQRVADLEAGKTAGIPAEQVLAEIRAMIADHRTP